jgi:hypothetical protein
MTSGTIETVKQRVLETLPEPPNYMSFGRLQRQLPKRTNQQAIAEAVRQLQAEGAVEVGHGEVLYRTRRRLRRPTLQTNIIAQQIAVDTANLADLAGRMQEYQVYFNNPVDR